MLFSASKILLSLGLLFSCIYLQLCNSVSLSALLASNQGVLNVIHGSGQNKFALKVDPLTGASSKHKIHHDLFLSLKKEQSVNVVNSDGIQCLLRLNITQYDDNYVISIPSLERLVDDRGRVSQDKYRPHVFTRDFKFVNLKHVEIILIKGYENRHPFVYDPAVNTSASSDATMCAQWAPRRLFKLDVPTSCVKDHTRIVKLLPAKTFGNDEIKAAMSAPYDVALNPDMLHRKCWIYISQYYQQRYTSQGKQDGLLEFIFNRIGVTNKFAVEFGYDGDKDNGRNGANTYNLVHKHGFNALLMDGMFQNKEIHLYKEKITPENIASLFLKYRVPRSADYVSIDIDSIDLWVFRALLSDRQNYRPRVISVEYNINFPLESTITCSAQCPPFKCRLFGASFGALLMVANEFNYTLVGVVELLDMFFVRNEDLNTDLIIPVVEFYRRFTGKPYLPKTCAEKYGLEGISHVYNYTRDYKTWLDSKYNESESRRAGLAQLEKLKIKL